MTVSFTKIKFSYLRRQTAVGALLSLSCLVPASSLAAEKDKRPPTLDPTYGLRIAKTAPVSAADPKTDAHWIWAERTASEQTVGLRGAFTLAQVPHNATLYITADDFFTCYVNGKQVEQSVPNPADTFVWKHVHRQNIARYLQVGKNVIALKALNNGGQAGAIARLEADGKPLLLTDGSWKVFDGQNLPPGWTNVDFSEGAWKNARVVTDLTGDPWASVGGLEGWPGYDLTAPYMAHITLDPAANLDARNGRGKLDATLPGVLTTTFAGSDPLNAPSVVVDFGKEIAGRVEITATSGNGIVVVGTGESQEEAVKSPWGGTHRLELLDGKAAYTPYSAFRYAKLTFLPSAETGNVDKTASVTVKVDHKYYPVEYKGAFDCSDSLLTRIWYTGAYTSHLCMQEDIWDAPKRDRARWMGDLHVSGAVINLAFADRFLMEQTMQRLRDEAQGGGSSGDMPKQHVNGIPGYSCAWICGLADFHRHIGDYEYLNRQHNLLISMLDYFKGVPNASGAGSDGGELDGRGLFANNRKAWPFVDWSPDFNGDSPRARAATHLFLIKAAREAAFLLFEMGDEANGKRYAKWAGDLTDAAQRYLFDQKTHLVSDRRQDNAMAIYAGVADKEQTQAIYDNILRPDSSAWKQIATPYYNNYIIYAMSMAGHTSETLGVLHTYWGGMLNEDATSWWEAYDPAWEKQDFHSHLQADNGTGYFVSLAHGWSAGPTSWLTERVLGVRPTGGGFKTVDVTPDLGTLEWAEGDVPTPRGNLHVRVDKQRFGLKLSASVPAGSKATLSVPGKTIFVSGPKSVTVTSPYKPVAKPL